MSAPLRIERRQIVKTANSTDTEEKVKFYIEKLLVLIPGEAQSLFALHTVIPNTDRAVLNWWITFCFVVIIVVRVFGTADRKEDKPPDYKHVLISCVAFALWLFSLGYVLPEIQRQKPYLSLLITAAFIFIVPYVYKRPVTQA